MIKFEYEIPGGTPFVDYCVDGTKANAKFQLDMKSGYLAVVSRPVWFGDDGIARIGHSDDMRSFLDDMNIKTSAG